MSKFSSVFGQILQIFSKAEFYKAVKEIKAEKGAKGFSCWEQFVAMLFCQLGQAHSLREICGGLATCLGKLLIELCVTLFDWAGYRQTKGAVKLRLLLDHEGYLPVFACITEGKVHEVKIARTLTFPKGSILAIDMGYVADRDILQGSQAEPEDKNLCRHDPECSFDADLDSIDSHTDFKVHEVSFQARMVVIEPHCHD